MEYLRVLTVIIIVLTYLIVAGKARFIVQPVSVERAEGLEAVFRCQYQEEGVAVTYDWAINNSLVGTDTESVRARRPSSPGEQTTLTILATPQHNNSVVQCVARVPDGIIYILRSELSATATLTVWATIITTVLTAPNIITVMWNGLPLTNYSVDITKITLDSTETMVFDSVCELTDPVCELTDQYIFMYSNNSVCDRFSFTVTPTEGEMRGTTSEPDTGFFTRAKGSGKRHSVCENGRNGENKSVKFETTVPNCTSFTRYRVDSDLLTIPISGSITGPLFDGSFDFHFPTDNKIDYNVTLTDENGIDLVFENIPLSTFDVQDLQVSECPGGGCISVSIVYVEGTFSPGALVCVMRFIGGELDFTSMKLVTIPYSMSENFIITLPNGSYRVIAFDLEKNVIPRIPISMAADSKNVTVNSGNEDTTRPPRPSRASVSAIKLPSGNVEVTCSDSALNCLVLFRSPSIIDGLIVDFINSTYNSTVLSLMDTYSDGYVVVYSWNSSQSIFEGWESLFKRFDQPTTAPTIHPPTHPTTHPPTHPTVDPQTDLLSESQLAAVIAGIVVTVIVIVLIVIVLIVVCCVVKKHKRNKNLGATSENPPPPMIRGAPAPAPAPTPLFIPAGVENQLVDDGDQSVSNMDHDSEAIGGTKTQEDDGVDTNDESVQEGAENGAGNSADHDRQEAAQCLVETKPTSSDAKVVDSTTVIQSEVDKVPVDPSPDTQGQGIELEAVSPRQEKNDLNDPDSLPFKESSNLNHHENVPSLSIRQFMLKHPKKDDIRVGDGLPVNLVTQGHLYEEDTMV